MPVVNRTPYRNLILTGTAGVGKTNVGRRIAERMDDAHFIDLEIEIQRREGYTPAQIRETFGVARLQSLESNLIEEMTLRRSTIIAASGATLLDSGNLDRLRETGPVLCLVAALGEILRRLHVSQGARFHFPETRAQIIGRLKRERGVLELDLAQLDTTGLGIDQVVQQAADFWLQQSDL